MLAESFVPARSIVAVLVLASVAPAAWTACAHETPVAVAPTSDPSPSTSATSSDPPRDKRERPRTSRITPELVAHALAFPNVLTPKLGASLSKSEGDAASPSVEWSAEYASHADGNLTIVTLLLYRGRSTFQDDFERPLLSSAPANVRDGWRARIEASDVAFDVAPSRVAHHRMASMGMGGAMVWATLTSPRTQFDLVLVFDLYLHDYPLTDAGRASLGALATDRALGDALRVIDDALWSP